MSPDRVPVVAAVRQLPGVVAVQPDHEPGGAVTGLRVWLSPGSDRRVVEAAIRRVSNAHFGNDAGQDRVRIVEQAEVPAPQGTDTRAEVPLSVPALETRGRSARPLIVRTLVETTGVAVTATVVLSAGSRTAAGCSAGVATGGGVRRMVATATVQALEELLPGHERLVIEHVEVQQAQPRAALVRLNLVSATGEQPLTGAALVRNDETDAVVRATLDAANRRFEALLT